MSRVYVAHDAALGRRVVVKTLSPEAAGSLSVERFRREVRLVAALQQANIVPVHAAGEMGGLPFYTMPFVEGESLRSRLAARGPLPIREVVGILRDVARALAYAHEHGVVHRDIKPDNVLISGNTAVVTDFGIAKALEASRTVRDSATLTGFGMALGTPAYIAPEQAAGEAGVDRRADLYALGVMAYEMLAGAPPFTAPTSQALLAAHVTQHPADIATHRADVPRALAGLVMRCLEKDPARRPQSATEVLEVLDAASTPGGQPLARGMAAKPSIAVLPFANLSPDPADEFFADGLTDEIITDLSPVGALQVIARASMMRFKGSTKDPQTVARELNVRYVLDGSVRRAGSSLRLTARLIDADDGSTIWTDKLGGLVEDVFAMQERVSRTIVDALQLKLTPREEAQLTARPITDLRAYECYLQAHQAMWTFTTGSLDRAYRLLNDALALTGDNVLLLSALGVLHVLYTEAGGADPARHLEAAEGCARRLEALDPDSFGLHALRGVLRWRRGEIREAIASLSRAHELQPNRPDVLAQLCYAHLLAGHDERAREAADLLVRLDPLTPLFQCMPGFCEGMAGRFAAAVPHYRRFLEMDPSNPAAHLYLAWTLAEAGERAEALEQASTLAREFPETVFGHLGLGLAHALRGDMTAGKAALTHDVRQMSRTSEAFARPLACILTMLGDFDAALDALEDAVRLGLAHYPVLAHRSSLLAPLRDQPRFQRLLEVVRERWARGGTSAGDLA